MATKSADARLRATVDTFVAELSAIVQESTLETVTEALGAAAPKRPGRPRAKATKKPRAAKVRKGGRRSAGDVAATQARVVAHVRANQGCSVSDIAAALGLTTKDLQLPVKKLVEDGKLRTTGQRRGTRYHTSRGTGKAAKKTDRRKTAKKTTRRKKGKKKARRKTGKKRGA